MPNTVYNGKMPEREPPRWIARSALAVCLGALGVGTVLKLRNEKNSNHERQNPSIATQKAYAFEDSSLNEKYTSRAFGYDVTLVDMIEPLTGSTRVLSLYHGSSEGLPREIHATDNDIDGIWESIYVLETSTSVGGRLQFERDGSHTYLPASELAEHDKGPGQERILEIKSLLRETVRETRTPFNRQRNAYDPTNTEKEVEKR